MKTFNLNGDEWNGTRDREGWRGKGALVGQRVGALVDPSGNLIRVGSPLS
jgi:hypothetical protein